jgi:hypothetical protein
VHSFRYRAGQEVDHAAGQQTDSKGRQEIDHAACRQMDRKGRRCSMHQADRNGRAGDRSGVGQQTNSKGRAGDVACIRPTDGQKRQGRRLIMQHVGRQERQAGDGSFSMSADEQGQGRDGQKKQDKRWNRQPAADR